MRLHNILFICCLIGIPQLYAQQEASIWYFGEHAGLDFRSGSPVPLLDSAMDTDEGCSVISDRSGNLIFYTDGTWVYNRNHQQMPNGFGLLSGLRATQVLVVPDPGNSNQYYIFTVANRYGAAGMRYSIVDMTQDGGLGDITTKNVFMTYPTVEKLTSVKHANGTDYWVIAHGWENNTFMAYLVTPTGVQPTPVTTNIGFVHEILPVHQGGAQEAGYMKFSPDGTKLAVATFRIGAELFDFDNATGVLSNRRVLKETTEGIDPVTGLENIVGAYGIEFSRSGELIYFATLGGEVYQFDVNAFDIAASQIRVDSGIDEIPKGALQMGIDGKIYMVQNQQQYLGVIENPEIRGLGCNYISEGLHLGGRTAILGLPTFVQTFFLVSFTADNRCLGDTTEFTLNSTDPVLSISWDFGDGHTSTLENPDHTYATAGTYTVEVTVETASETKTETQDITISRPPVANTVNDVALCATDSNHTYELSLLDTQVLDDQDPTQYGVAYFGSQADADSGTNALTDSYALGHFGTTTLYARIQNKDNIQCHDTTSFGLALAQQPVLNTVEDWKICGGNGAVDLTQKDGDILNGQDPTTFAVSYHLSAADATAGTNALDPEHTLPDIVQTIYFRIYNRNMPQCHGVGSFEVQLFNGITTTIEPWTHRVCDTNSDGYYTFDLSVLGGQYYELSDDRFTVNVRYFETAQDRDNGTNPVNAAAYTNTVPYQQTLYTRVEYADHPDCFYGDDLPLRIFDAPQVDTVTDWVACDDDGDLQYTFDLSQKNDEILNGVDGDAFDIAYYPSEADALTGTNALPTLHTNTGNPETVFYRIENNQYRECHQVGSFALEVLGQVTAHTPDDLTRCDDDHDGKGLFDLSQVENQVLGGQSASGLRISYHGSQAEADTDMDPLPVQYQSDQAGTTVYVRVSNATDATCYDTTSFQLFLFEVPTLSEVADWYVCDDNGDGTHLFDLTEKWDEILGGQDSGTFGIHFFASQSDAEQDRNFIMEPYVNTANPQTLYYRIFNGQQNSCYVMGSFDIEVLPPPVAHIPEDVIACDENGTGFQEFVLGERDGEVLNGQDALQYTVSYHATRADAEAGTQPLPKEGFTNTGAITAIHVRAQHVKSGGCYDIARFDLIVNPLPQLDLEETYVICPDTPQLEINGGDFERYQWRNASGTLLGTTPNLTIGELGTYSLTVSQTAYGRTCENTAHFEVLSSGAPESISVETHGFSDTIELVMEATGHGEFEYSIDGEHYQRDPIFEVLPGTYTVYVRDLLLCRTLSQEVTAVGYLRFFTPNNDGVNDSWNIIGGEHMAHAQVYIFDRYGKMLTQLSPDGEGWDGTYNGQLAPAADYWFHFVDGDTYDVKGHFTLKR
ncbi:MAG: T9SS type B sorting domain-containing protein [Flavobacteriaceae bacterium]